MTRKHYIALADWANKNNMTDRQLEGLIEVIGPLNKQFNKQKFLERAKND